MRKLWRERQTAPEPFNATNDIHLLDCLPYERLYDKLNAEELLQLIKDAKQNRWELLDLSECGLTALPDELWELTDLKGLWLYNNNIKILPRNIEKLQNLEFLDISHNPITCDSNRPLDLPKLVNLDCYGCYFPQLPKAFQIPSLKILRFNCLEKTLSDDILKLKNLKKLNLSYSSITQLPDNIKLLENLKELYLNLTYISSLPASIANLKNLMYLGMDYTPLEKKLPPEILRQGAQSIIRYVLEMQSDNTEKEFFNESKMVIVGQGDVGKTCVLNRLIHNKYVEKPSTEGIDIQTWDFEELGENYRLNVWDFGGQEIYHSTHQFFLSKRSLYLFVWDARAEDEYGRIDYWLKTIKSLAGDSPIIIAVNKCDINTGRVKAIDKVDIKRRYPQVQGIFNISCKDGTGIEELRTLVKYTASQLPLMKQKWFASWLNVRKEIEELSKKENIISYTDYLKICQKHSIEEETDALSLIRFLHDLGIVLHYHDDSLLKHIVILSTEWGTDAVYKVLDEQDGQLKGYNGILPLSFLPFIWDDKERYPEDKFNYLLTLMEKFQLAFKVDDKNYLVAELLENNEITLDYTFPHEQTLGFRYEYDFIPAGIMTRFIVLANQYLVEKADQKQCWAKGAYLKYGNAYALVKLHDNLTEHFVDIKISGGYPDERRAFLTLIRATLDEINKRFKDIKITEKIPCSCSKDCKYLFNYEFVIKALRKGKNTVTCEETADDVDIAKLLEGVERKGNNPDDIMTDILRNKLYIINNFNPTNNNNNNNTSESNSTATATVENNISIEIKTLINGLQGDYNALKGALNKDLGGADENCEIAEEALNELDQCKDEDEIVKKGVLSKLEYFIEQALDKTTKIGAIIDKSIFAFAQLKKIVEKFAKIAVKVYGKVAPIAPIILNFIEQNGINIPGL